MLNTLINRFAASAIGTLLGFSLTPMVLGGTVKLVEIHHNNVARDHI